MTKEQEEAIEMLEDIKNNTWTTKYIMSSDSVKAETVLSILKEKDKEIERLEKVLEERYLYVPGMRTVYARLMCLDKEDIVKDDLKLRNEIYQHIEDNEKKDKIIDLMARAFKQDDVRTVEEIKQYYERKSEE